MANLFKSVRSTQLLSHTVEEKIQQAIAEKHLMPGDRLPTEMELCQQFEVSRTVMREALRVLSSRGLISIEKGRGMFVNRLTPDSVTEPFALFLHMNHNADHKLHVIEARQMFEPEIAADAARHHSPEDDERLKRNYQQLVEIGEDVSSLSSLDMAFHLMVAEATQNPVVPLLMKPIHQLMPVIKKSVYKVVQDAHQSAVEWHGKILEAILASDPAGAHKAMADHLEIAKHHILRISDVESETAPVEEH
jgi:GntR family transcriptional repressor for pyruvate dehydrogenase complex